MNRKYRFYLKLCQAKFVDFIETNNFVFYVIFVFHMLLLKKIEISILNNIFLNYKEKYYEKMLLFKFVDLYVVNNFVS